MKHEEGQPAPFDQQAALEELERFGRDIERYRAQREAIGEQFESFIRSFETPPRSPSAPVRPMPTAPQVVTPAAASNPAAAETPPVTSAVEATPVPPTAEPPRVTPAVTATPAAAPIPAAAEPPSPASAAAATPATPAVEPSPGTPAVTATPVMPAAHTPAVTAAADVEPVTSIAESPAAEIVGARPVVEDSEGAVTPAIVHDDQRSASDTTPAPMDAPESLTPLAAPPGPARSRSRTPVLVGGVLLAVLAGAALVVTLLNRGGESAAPAAVAPETPVAAPDPTPAPATPPPATAIAPPPSQSQITTIRRVWMRVTVDGERVLEREVPAGTTVPLNAEQSIVIRTGDAGAVQLSIRGEPRRFLGAEGQVVTRTFTVPARAPAGPAGR